MAKPPQPRQYRKSIGRNDEIFKRAQAGEPFFVIAKDYGITGARVGQIVQQIKDRSRNGNAAGDK